MKNICSIFFLLIANTLLWAHAVVPHHHHGQIACFITSHCHEGEHAGNDCCSDHKHQGNETSCKLLQEVVLSKNNVLPHTKNEACDHGCPLHAVVLPGLLSIEEPVALIVRYDFCSPPPLLSFYISGACGLRAPPVC